MTASMSSKERVLAAATRQPVDYVPCAPFMNSQDWPQRVGRRWQYPFGPSRPEMLHYVVGELGLDQIVPVDWMCFPEAAVSAEVHMEGDTLHKRLSTPAGDLCAAVTVDEKWPHGFDIPLFSDYNPAHFVEPWVKTLADLECLRHILQPPQTRQDLEAVRFDLHQARRLADQYDLAICFEAGLGLSGALQVFGATQLCMAAIAEPDLVDAYLEMDHQLNLKNYEIALDLGADIIRRNGFYESCDYFSPQMLGQFLGERLRAEIDLVHQAGRVIGYTLLSGIMPMLDHLAGLDFDCLFCPDVFLRDGDGIEINRKLGDRKAFWTGPSDTIHMPWERPDEVRQAVRHVFDVFGKRGLVITPCSSSKAVFPWANVLAMVDEWQKLR